MRNLFILFGLVLLNFAAKSQSDSLFHKHNSEKSNRNYDDKTEYVFNTKRLKMNTIGLYLAPEIGSTQLNSKLGGMGGGSIMLLINKKIAFGLAGYIAEASIAQNPKNNLGVGGLKLEYVLKPNAKVHFSFPLLIGRSILSDSSNRNGHIQTKGYRKGSANGGYDGNNHYRKKGSNQFGILQPGINLEANLVKHIKVFGGVSYRFAFADNKPDTVIQPIDSKQVSGLSVSIGLKFGIFDYPIHKRDSIRKAQQYKSKNHR